MPEDLIDSKSTLVQVMAWYLTVPSHYLSQCWPQSLTPYGITRYLYFLSFLNTDMAQVADILLHDKANVLFIPVVNLVAAADLTMRGAMASAEYWPTYLWKYSADMYDDAIFCNSWSWSPWIDIQWNLYQVTTKLYIWSLKKGGL